MKKHLLKVIKSNHFDSLVHSFITDLVWSESIAMIAHNVVQGDFSKNTLLALGYAVFRTAAKALKEWIAVQYPKK